MSNKYRPTRADLLVFLVLVLSVLLVNTAFCADRPEGSLDLPKTPLPKSELDLKNIPFKIVYETFRTTAGKGNWEIYLINADGSDTVNLTRTPDVDEMYPHASPDGTKICFVADEGTGESKVRNVYYINLDGSVRVKVAHNARQPCWSPDSKTIAYLKGEFDRYTVKDYATKGVFFYDLKTRAHKEHPNKNLHHLYNIAWSSDGEWFVATVHGGMGFRHAILAFRIDDTNIYDLTKFKVTGCRPDFSPDDKRITWGMTDWDLCVAKIDLASEKPRITDVKCIVQCDKEYEVYHTDFSPDGKYIAFSYGPKAQEMVGGKAPGWNICITDMDGKWTQITTDGNHNKEPDWVPIAAK